MTGIRKALILLRRWWAAALVIGLLLVWASRSISLTGLPFMPDATWSRVQSQGVIRIGTDASYPPLANLTPDGAFEGLDVDLGRGLAAQLGVQAEFVNIHWDGLFGALDAGKVDMVIAAVPYDGTLTRDLSYSGPYADLGLVLVARDGLDYDAALAGEAVAVELGSEAHLFAKRRAREAPGMTLLVARTTDELAAWLAEGQADLAICDRVTGGRLAAMPDLTLIVPPLQSAPVYVVTAREAGKLGPAVQEALVELEKSGALAAIVTQWLGSAQ